MYCKHGDKIAALKIKIALLEFPESARNKIMQGILNKDFLAEWETLKNKVM